MEITKFEPNVLIVALTVILAALKLDGANISWMWVVSPIWIVLIVAIILVVIALLSNR